MNLDEMKMDETGGKISGDDIVKRTEDFKEIVEQLVKAVVENQVEVSIDIEPDRCEIRLEPWRPMRMQCPYGRNEEG